MITINCSIAKALFKTRCQILCSMPLQCVSKILTPRMLKKSSLMAKINHWNNSFQSRPFCQENFFSPKKHQKTAFFGGCTGKVCGIKIVGTQARYFFLQADTEIGEKRKFFVNRSVPKNFQWETFSGPTESFGTQDS